MRTWSDEQGSSTLAVTAAAGFGLAVFVLLANVVLLHYARGVARTAVDEAVRYGVVSQEACLDAAESVLSDLLGGRYGAELDARCHLADGTLLAVVSGTVPSLLPAVAGHPIEASASLVLPDG